MWDNWAVHIHTPPVQLDEQDASLRVFPLFNLKFSQNLLEMYIYTFYKCTVALRGHHLFSKLGRSVQEIKIILGELVEKQMDGQI